MGNSLRRFGLIGYPLGHSWSKGYFTRKFDAGGFHDCRYDNFEIPDISLLSDIIAGTPDLIGLNVTIPYKQAVIPMLSTIDPIARSIGAVNTIKIDRHQGEYELSGFNTDITGFRGSLSSLTSKMPAKALIFGTGGSSLAVRFALREMGIGYISISREGGPDAIPYQDLSENLAEASKLWINCTPVGMYPNISGELPLPWNCISHSHILFDLIYNPEETRFLKHGREAGALTINGLSMLLGQAEASWDIWNQYPD